MGSQAGFIDGLWVCRLRGKNLVNNRSLEPLPTDPAIPPYSSALACVLIFELMLALVKGAGLAALGSAVL